jgi:hypothetical protein
LYRVYHLKCNPATIMYCGTKIESEAGVPPCNRLSQPPPWHLNQGHPGRCARHVHKSFAVVNVVYSQTEHVFIPKLYFSLKLFAAVHETFSSVYPDKVVLNKAMIHQLVTKFWDRGSLCLWQVLIKWQNSWNYGRTYLKQCITCNIGIWLQEFNIAIGFVILHVKGFVCSS